MPDPVPVALDAATPDATATPESKPSLSGDQKATLKEVGLDPEQVGSFMESKAGWDAQQNRRLMEIADEKRNDKIAAQMERQNDLVEKVAERFIPEATPDAFIPVKAFMETYGLSTEQDLDREMSYRDAYRLIEYAGQKIGQRIDPLMSVGEDGSPLTMSGIVSKLNEIDAKATVSHDAVTKQHVDAVRGAIGTKYELADPAVADRAISEASTKGLTGVDFRDFVLEKVKLSHEHFEGVADAARMEERRKHVAEPGFTGAGEGATPAGEKPLNPWNRADRDRIDTRT